MISDRTKNKKVVDHEDPFCTHCGANLMEQPGFNPLLSAWICKECGQVLTGGDGEDKRFPGVVQLCDECGAILDNQAGFSDWLDEWKCTECGHVNKIDDSEYEIEERYQFEKNRKSDGMTVKEARIIEEEFYRKSNPSGEEEFMYIEAMDFLISEEKNPSDMMSLGGYYYELKRFDLALKYYEMASTYDSDAADECLGYIWYYGRTGEKDYEKAYKYYSRAMERGNLVCTYKVADMYKNGYYVEKDYDKYVSIIEELYPKVKYARNLGEPLPEVFTRLAKIRTRQNRPEDAVDLYFRAKDFLAQRLSYNAFFGHLNIMKWMIDDLYELIEFDVNSFDFYDLYYLLNRPSKVRFTFEGKEQHLESLIEEGACIVHFNDKWYRDRDEFFQKACIGNERLTAIYDRLEDFEVI
ncbi:tetratricopeptide repeat protein [Butyrivibrio sp. FCS006]|uniref:tetratricopeptide repeat protein n=1 Tax=Butyrivibrio sp. FCS006 TaxID=1280684 RepID=UPI000478D242|nr:tetratricopeptide repeat protein [Butyrivibrio sp. FCS006]